MSGVTAPPWRSRLYLATNKVRDKSAESLQACTRQVRYTPIADVSLRRSEPPLRANMRNQFATFTISLPIFAPSNN